MMLIQKAFASGTTNTSSNPGQVLTRSQDGVLYLDTRTNGNTTAISNNETLLSSSLPSNRINFTSTSQIVKPNGFVNDLGVYLSSILSLVMVVCLLLVFYNFIQAGFQWITSGGDKSKLDDARMRIINAFIGIIIVSASFAIAGFVAYILGLGSVQEVLTTIPKLNTI
jgi:hypothetical protein